MMITGWMACVAIIVYGAGGANTEKDGDHHLNQLNKKIKSLMKNFFCLFT
jgi:hypothetical protein